MRHHAMRSSRAHWRAIVVVAIVAHMEYSIARVRAVRERAGRARGMDRSVGLMPMMPMVPVDVVRCRWW